jgi:exodeoxyribonuclease VII large subunit
LSRSKRPDSDPLWGDLPELPAGREAGSREPPEWALPAWDAVGESSPPSRNEPRTLPGERLASVTTPDPMPPPAGAERSRVEGPGVERQASAASSLRILGVSEVTRVVRDAVREQSALRDVWVEGEVGRVTVSSAGHCYFTLKDEKSQLACVFFRDDRAGSPFEARTGLRIVAHGRVDVFESQGVYQLYVAAIQPSGFGDLALQFEALKARLAAEGLFDSARKRALPYRPPVVGVATSATGAVWHDICHVVSRRWPLARLVLSACQVQGEGAAQSVVAALDRLARWGDGLRAAGRAGEAPAVVILARGGGSLEDLWPFNDERVVRAVVAHPVPVVCGVGHEVDVTLADFAADVRAPTPSAAAELVVPDSAEVAGDLAELERRGRYRIAAVLTAARNEIAAEARALEGTRPEAQLAQARERAGYLLDRASRCIRTELSESGAATARLASRLSPAIDGRIAGARLSLDRSGAALKALGPQATLDRGYAIVRRLPDGQVVRDPSDAPRGRRLSIRVARGELTASVEDAPASGGPRPERGDDPDA